MIELDILYKPRGFFQVFLPFIFCHQFSSFFFSICKCRIWQINIVLLLYCMHDEQRQKFPIVRLTSLRLSITKELMERLSYDYSNLNRLKGINKFQPVLQVIMLIKLSF